MWGLAIIFGLSGIIGLFVFLALKLPDEYNPVRLLFWLLTPLMISIGFFTIMKLAEAEFASTTAAVFSSLFSIWIGLMIFLYIYFAGMGIVLMMKNWKEKKTIERLSKI